MHTRLADGAARSGISASALSWPNSQPLCPLKNVAGLHVRNDSRMKNKTAASGTIVHQPFSAVTFYEESDYARRSTSELGIQAQAIRNCVKQMARIARIG